MFSLVLRVVFILIVVCHAALIAAAGPKLPRDDRSAFAERSREIKEGSRPQDVLAILGRPDRIIHYSPFDYESIEEWHYGVDVETNYPTFGRVRFERKPPSDDDYKKGAYVVEVCGDGGKPPSKDIISEANLRVAIGRLSNSPNALYDGFDPLAAIAAVNVLRPLGKKTTIAVIEEYLRVASNLEDPGHRVVLLVRYLFEPSEGSGGWLPYVDHEKALGGSRFPLALVEDVPISVNHEYPVAAAPRTGREELAWAKNNADLPVRLLTPPKNPLALFPKIEKIPEMKGRRFDINRRVEIAGQLLRCDPTRSFSDKRVLLNFAFETLENSAWPDVVNSFNRHPIQWDTTRSKYVIKLEPFDDSPSPEETRRACTGDSVEADEKLNRALQELRQDDATDTALAAAWQTLVRKVVERGRGPRETLFQKEDAAWFLGFVEGRLQVNVPSGWAQMVRDGKLNPDDKPVFRRNRETVYEERLPGIYTNASVDIRLKDDKYLLTANEQTVALPWKMLAGTSKKETRLDACIRDKRVFVASLPDAAFSFHVGCIALDTEPTSLWSSEVRGGALKRLGGPTWHYASIAASKKSVVVFGAYPSDLYIEGFDADTGRTSFRFHTRYPAIPTGRK